MPPAYPMLLSTVNCSVGDKKRHLTIQNLCDLFLNIKAKEKRLTDMEKYAIYTMQTEAYKEEFEWFQKDYNIPQENIDYVLKLKVY